MQIYMHARDNYMKYVNGMRIAGINYSDKTFVNCSPLKDEIMLNYIVYRSQHRRFSYPQQWTFNTLLAARDRPNMKTET